MLVSSGPHTVDAVKLPTPPAIALKILEAAKKPGVQSVEIANLIALDPALSVKVLSMANSPLYTPGEGVTSIQRAIDVLGMTTVVNLALSFLALDTLRGNGDQAFNYIAFWRRSVTRAVAAKAVAALLKKPSDDIFTIALLADIGKVLMFLVRPDDYQRVNNELETHRGKDYVIEEEVFTYSHAAMGEETLRHWGLPASITVPVALHHDTQIAEDDNVRHLVRLIQTGDLVSDIYFGDDLQNSISMLKSLLYSHTDIDNDTIVWLIDSAAVSATELLRTFDIPAGQIKPYSEILQEANEQLAVMNLKQEVLVRRLQEEKRRADTAIEKLKKMAEQLKEMATTDGLTTLRNHKQFQLTLSEEMSRAKRYGYPVSLLVLDIDDFKRVNDSYGHLAGDMVLKSVAAAIVKSCRDSDTASRYGGEEFAVILPETDVRGAASFAERLRGAIEAFETEVYSQRIRVTASIGVAIYDPRKRDITKDNLFNNADSAVYHSKRTGKNKVSIASA